MELSLEDLIGDHELSGVDESSLSVEDDCGYKADVDIVRFTLDNVTYKATEDPSDGYRSYLEGIEITEEKPRNQFIPHAVIGKMKPKDDYQTSEIIQFFDKVTGELVFEVGTDDTEDYYPFCVMFWNPEGLAMNRKD